MAYMDPQTCFDMFIEAVKSGDLETAAECQQAYNFSRLYPAECERGKVIRLDHEQDRYLVRGDYDGWVSCYTGSP